MQLRLSHTTLAVGLFAFACCLGIGARGAGQDGASTTPNSGKDISWGLELGLGSMSRQHSPYIDRLRVFGFGDDNKYSGLRAHAAVDRRVQRYFAIGADLTHLESFTFARDQDTSTAKLVPGSFTWDTYALSAYVRAGYPLLPEVFPFVHVGLGAAWSSSELALKGASLSDEAQWGPMATLGVGLHIASPYVGIAIAYLHTFASVLENRFGDDHDSSGTYLLVSLRIQVLERDL